MSLKMHGRVEKKENGKKDEEKEINNMHQSICECIAKQFYINKKKINLKNKVNEKERNIILVFVRIC